MGRSEHDLLAVLLEYGGEVIGPQGDIIGRFVYLLINTEMASIEYGILSLDSDRAGRSGKMFYAVPWLAVKNADRDARFFVDIEPSQFREAPGFDLHDWPDFTDPRYQDMIYGFYYYNTPAGRRA